MKTLFSCILGLSLTFGTLIGCEKVVTPMAVNQEQAPSAPSLNQYIIGVEISVEGVRAGFHPNNDRIVYLTAFGDERWVLYLNEDVVIQTDRLITVEGIYIGTREDGKEILVDVE